MLVKFVPKLSQILTVHICINFLQHTNQSFCFVFLALHLVAFLPSSYAFC